MNQSEQIASSRKYVMGCFSLVRVPDGVALIRCRGSERELVRVFAIYSELVTYLLEEYDQALFSADREAERQAKREATRTSLPSLSADDLFGLNLDIDL